jgi:serine/threonine protein kinase
LKNPHIINLYDVFNENYFYYLVTELMLGGELFDRIVTKTFYNEKEARDVCKILFGALGYCHDRGVAHRDLKPENLLLMSKDDDLNIKIADFGFAKKATSDKCLLTQCGTPGYVAPEILHGVPYGTKADMWSLGVITYILLGGYPPFIEQNQRELFKKIKRGSFEFHPEYWAQISPDAKELISKLLTVDPDRRMSASKALSSKWITGSDEILAGKDLGANLDAFRKFNAKRKLRQAVLTVSISKTNSHIIHGTYSKLSLSSLLNLAYGDE